MSRRSERRARVEASHVGIDSLLGWHASEPGPARRVSKVASALKGVAASVVIAGLCASVTLPAIGVGAITMREAGDYWASLPSDLPKLPLPQKSVILAADGSKIAEFYSENRVLVALDEVPDHMVDAIVAIEDSRFYEHAGVDVRGTARALINNLTGGAVQGGSTLTQQYVKNVLFNAATDEETKGEVTSQTSYLRKLREAKLALATEQDLSKDQILEGYLNIAYFGDGAYGIGTAARHFFNVEVEDLTVAQSALLAGLVKNPTGYDPTDNLKQAQQRRDVVLARMRALGFIGARAHREARKSEVRLDLTSAANGCYASEFPFFCQWVKNQLQEDPVFGETPAERQRRIFQGGMTIRTTLDPKAQRLAQASVDGALGRRNRVAAAAVTVEPGTGHVVSMALNRGYGKGEGKTELILPVLPAFQPGSTFKPFTLAAALERGYDPTEKVSTPSIYAPANMNYPGAGFTNSGSASAGLLSAEQALWRSSNTFFVRLEEQVGVLNVANMAERLGITSLPRTGPRALTPRDASLTLGAYEVSPLEMAGAFATFAAQGVHCTPVGITSITGPDGNDIAVPDPDCHEALPASVANTVAAIMKGAIDGPDPFRTGADLSLGRPAAGKTGTTQNNSAVWFAGYTPQYATSVWVGDPRGGFRYPLQNFYAYGQYIARAYGGSVAGPIWERIMAGLHQNLPVRDFAPPGAISGYRNVVPDVRGMDVAQAVQVLTAAGYKVTLAQKTAAKDPLLRPDRVHSLDPVPGALIGLGTTVTLVLTHGSNLNLILPGQGPSEGNSPDGARDGDGGVVTADEEPRTPGSGDRDKDEETSALGVTSSTAVEGSGP